MTDINCICGHEDDRYHENWCSWILALSSEINELREEIKWINQELKDLEELNSFLIGTHEQQ